MRGSPEDAVGLDVALLAGLRFACRPDCGLCCYATPRVARADKPGLLRILSESEFFGRGPDEFLRSRGDGGACVLLRDLRCRGHDVRPYPCREFPISVHVGERLQATAVLSCPGVRLGGADDLPGDGTAQPSEGLAEELSAVRGRLGPGTIERLAHVRRRHRKVTRALERDGRWEPTDEVRAALRRSPPRISGDDFPVPDPPRLDDGRGRLPLFFDGRAGPVAIASGLGGWELEELAPEGGGRTLGVVPPLERVPDVAPDGTRLLAAYLAYWLARDQLFATVEWEMMEYADDRPVGERVAAELRGTGALVLARADARARLSRGAVRELTVADVAAGIRATDQDLLDRDGWGETL